MALLIQRYARPIGLLAVVAQTPVDEFILEYQKPM